jgi:hypothetical protein
MEGVGSRATTQETLRYFSLHTCQLDWKPVSKLWYPASVGMKPCDWVMIAHSFRNGTLWVSDNPFLSEWNTVSERHPIPVGMEPREWAITSHFVEMKSSEWATTPQSCRNETLLVSTDTHLLLLEWIPVRWALISAPVGMETCYVSTNVHSSCRNETLLG